MHDDMTSLMSTVNLHQYSIPPILYSVPVWIWCGSGKTPVFCLNPHRGSKSKFLRLHYLSFFLLTYSMTSPSLQWHHCDNAEGEFFWIDILLESTCRKYATQQVIIIKFKTGRTIFNFVNFAVNFYWGTPYRDYESPPICVNFVMIVEEA